MATTTAKSFGQSQPANTSAATIYTRPASTESILRHFSVANTTAAAASFRLFVHQSGTTYDATTALYYDISIDAYTTLTFTNLFIVLNTAGGTIGIRSDTANALTFSLYGIETA